MSETEIWKAIPGYVGIYEVSTRGGVRSLDRLDSWGRRRAGITLKPATHKSGHKHVALSIGGVTKDWGVHVLVLIAFIGPRPDKYDACHWNDIPADNRLENLRWGTRSENRKDLVRNGRHEAANKTHCPQGHGYTPENTYIQPNGARACKTCKRAYRDAHRDEQRPKDREYQRLRARTKAETENDRKVA